MFGIERYDAWKFKFASRSWTAAARSNARISSLLPKHRRDKTKACFLNQALSKTTSSIPKTAAVCFKIQPVINNQFDYGAHCVCKVWYICSPTENTSDNGLHRHRAACGGQSARRLLHEPLVGCVLVGSGGSAYHNTLTSECSIQNACFTKFADSESNKIHDGVKNCDYFVRVIILLDSASAWADYAVTLLDITIMVGVRSVSPLDVF